MDPKLKKWLSLLQIIKGELHDLVVAKYTFHEIQQIIKNNPLLHKPSSFYDYLAQTYVSHVVIGLRRQIKSDAQSISMARLFEEMIATPQSLSRKYFVNLYKGSAIEDLADSDFNNFSTPGSPYIDPALVAADLARLRDASARCEDFADKRVAHRDKREPKQLPTFNEVDGCIELLDQLYVRYFRLFHASDMDSLLPTWQYDWKAVFRVPWIAMQYNYDLWQAKQNVNLGNVSKVRLTAA